VLVQSIKRPLRGLRRHDLCRRIFTRKVLVFVALLFVMFGLVHADSATGETILNIAAPAQIVVGEPLVVRVSIHNTASDTLMLIAYFDPPHGLVGISITDPSGNNFLGRGGIHSITWLASSREYWDRIPPGDSLYGYVTLMHFSVRPPNEDGSVSFQLGEYVLRATYRFREIEIRSNEARVLLIETPDNQVAAREVFISGNTPDWTLLFSSEESGWHGMPRMRVAWEEVASTWPESIFGKYALYYLARLEQHLGNCDKAIEQYQRFLADYEGLPYSELAEVHIGECQAADRKQELELLLLLPEEYQRNAYVYHRVKWLKHEVEGRD